MRKVFFFCQLCLILCLPLTAQAQSRGGLLMASTIGPIDAGIVSVLEDQFEKEQ